MKITWRVISREEEGEEYGEMVQGIRSIICRYKIGEIKNSMGNEEAKELICMTHRHELKVGKVGGRGCAG